MSRWGRPTVNKLWGMGNKAVLLWVITFFAKAGDLTASTEEYPVTSCCRRN